MLLIPRIEDGNNFGVSIQEDILEEVRSAEGEAAIYYDETSKYHHSRAKIISKIAKYPFIVRLYSNSTQLICKDNPTISFLFLFQLSFRTITVSVLLNLTRNNGFT